MRYAISYVSTVKRNLPKEQINLLLKNSAAHNNSENITGLLLCSEGNFFELIEGEEDKIKELFARIKDDPRHKNIIKIVEKPIHRPAYDGFISRWVTKEEPYSDSKLPQYLHHIEVLEPPAREAVKKVLEAMITQS